MLGQWFSHSSVAHTNSVAKVFQSLLLTGNSFRLLVFGTNLIAFRCQCSLARRAIRSLAVHFLVAGSTSAFRRRYCPAGELALSPPPSPSLQPLASLLASACEPSWRAPLPAPSRRRRRLVTGPRLHYHHWQQSRPRVHVVVGAHGYQPRISGMYVGKDWGGLGKEWGGLGKEWRGVLIPGQERS